MKPYLLVSLVAFILGLAVPLLHGQPETEQPQTVVAEQDTGDKAQPKQSDKDKDKDKKKLPEPAPKDIFSDSLFPRSDLPTGFNPHMMGDFGVYFARRTFTVTGTTTQTRTILVPDNRGILVPQTITTTTPTTQTRTILIPIASAGGLKIAENESPRPQDRVFFTYNYFGAARGPAQASNDPLTTTQVLGNTTTTSVFPGAPRPSIDLHREIFGFEKTFLDGRASIELRLPVAQANSNVDGFGSRFVGDLTVIGKYAFLLDQTTGNVISGGLGITAPTGPSIQTIDGTLRTTYLQPWGGYIWNFDRFYVQGFHSVVVPTDPRDITFFFNDVGINWWLYRGAPTRVISSIVPVAECHVTTPLNHRSGNDGVYVPDLVVMTGGVHVGIFRNTSLSLGVATPVTGPRIFGIEAFTQLNWRF